MALKFSEGLVNKLMGMQAVPKAVYSEEIGGGNMAFVDGGGSSDTITDDASGFITAGFAPGDIIFCYGSTTAANDTAINNSGAGTVLTGVVAGTLTFATNTVNTAEAFAATTFIMCCKGGSVRDIFQDGVLRIYSGTVPATADAAITGTKLVEITLSSGAFTAGQFANGLSFGAPALGVIAKASGETWSGVALATGTATHYRLVGNATDADGASDTLPRIQGTVATSGADLNMSSTTITATETTTISTFTYTLAPS